MITQSDDHKRWRGELEEAFSTPPGWGRLATVNHSIVGMRFMITSLIFFALGGLLAMLIRAQLAVPDNTFLDHVAYNQIFTMHGTVMMFLFAIPMIEGLSLYFIPKFLGARDLCFPRLSAFGYWCYLFGGLILVVALFLNSAPDGGWFMYTPLSGKEFTPGINADIWLIGITFVEISAIAFGIELIATILKVRAAGMSLARLPLFGWYILVTAVMIVIGFPPLILGSVLLEIERAFGWPFFDVALGGDPLLWQHLFWLFGHPEVYIIFLPGAAAVSVMIPTFARRPLVGHLWVVNAAIATGFISFGLWVHHMFTVGIPQLSLFFFSVTSMFVAIPTAIQFFAWLATLWKGQPVRSLPMLYLFGFLFVFVCGGLTGVMLALVPFNWQAHDTYFVVAHLHYVLIGGFVFPMLAAVHYWLPLWTGKRASERLGISAFWLIFGGFNLTFLHMHLTGLAGMPRRIYTYSEASGWAGLNLLSTIGSFILAIGFAAFVIDLILRIRTGRTTEPNPWQAGTLEWGLDHPPASYNFASQPTVTSREPLWDQPLLVEDLQHGRGLLARPRHGWRETLGVHPATGQPDQIILLPRPSWIPLLTAALLALFFVSFLFGYYPVAVVGVLGALGCALRWAWTSGLDRDWPDQDAGDGTLLPLHPQASDPPGWWGMLGSILFSATLYISLLFGYLYLWAVTPGWPPERFIDSGPVWPLLTIFAAIASAFAIHRAVHFNARNQSPILALILAALLALVASVGCVVQAMIGLPPPTSHAYAAVTTVVLGFGGLHILLSSLFALYTACRCRAEFMSTLRSQDVRVTRLWASYAAGLVVISVVLVHALPALLGSVP